MDYMFPILVADLSEHPDCRFGFIGHSFGSLLVWLCLVYLRRAKHRMPDAVFIASKKCPLLHEVNGNAQILKETFEETKAL
jgi:surfactin synthase thioesterase subunit